MITDVWQVTTVAKTTTMPMELQIFHLLSRKELSVMPNFVDHFISALTSLHQRQVINASITINANVPTVTWMA
jgi:hypothetical protein